MIEVKCSKYMFNKAKLNTQFSTKKTRAGKKSVPFLGLNSGNHEVRFVHNKKEYTDCIVKVWLSMFGWAWIVKHEVKNDQ